MASEKRARYMERWRALGGGVGLSEAALRATSDSELQEELSKSQALETAAESQVAAASSSAKLPDEMLGNNKTAEEAAAVLDANSQLGEKAMDNEVMEQLSKVALEDKSS